MTDEFATSMEQLSYSTKEDIDTRVEAMMAKINTNASIQKEGQETMRGILNELMKTKAPHLVQPLSCPFYCSLYRKNLGKAKAANKAMSKALDKVKEVESVLTQDIPHDTNLINLLQSEKALYVEGANLNLSKPDVPLRENSP
ncbi:unnamed protein product [Ambrosiozyma monospora]|uniref:Unnamed protein product n=1 Tax=Ambrosiozyma monospora TaxID=43982 RepID=A0A9W6YW37_AMBMO|nr:unnamed protein product [Ambrosiozyma monospora]